VSDAIVIVVSEETGTISLARDGRLIRNLDPSMLRDSLHRLLSRNDSSGLAGEGGRDEKGVGR
jgi:hypothetical protein